MSRPERVFGSRAPSFWIQLRHKNDIVWHTTVVRKMFPEGTADDTIPHRDIEETKTTEPLPFSLPSPSSPPVSPRPSRDQCPFCFFEDRLPPVDRDRHYARIDSLRRHVLRVHLNQASRHGYGLRGLHQPDSDPPTEQKPIVCPVPACRGLVLQGENHYKSHSARVHKGPF